MGWTPWPERGVTRLRRVGGCPDRGPQPDRQQRRGIGEGKLQEERRPTPRRAQACCCRTPRLTRGHGCGSGAAGSGPMAAPVSRTAPHPARRRDINAPKAPTQGHCRPARHPKKPAPASPPRTTRTVGDDNDPTSAAKRAPQAAAIDFLGSKKGRSTMTAWVGPEAVITSTVAPRTAVSVVTIAKAMFFCSRGE